MNVGLSPFHQQNLDRSAGVPLSWVWITGGVRKSQSTKTAPAHQKNPTQYTCPHARSLRDNGLHDDKKVDHRNHLRNALSSSNACQGRSSVCLFVCLLVTIRYAHYQPASARATATVAIYSRNARAPSVVDDAEFRLIFWRASACSDVVLPSVLLSVAQCRYTVSKRMDIPSQFF